MSEKPTSFFEWIGSAAPRWRERPWLVLGKGPSFAKLGEFDTTTFNTFGLNHVVREVAVDLIHAIDIEVVVDCADLLLERARYLVLPWYPNQRSHPQSKSIDEWCDSIPVLARLSEQGRLLWYNRRGTPPHLSDPVVPVTYFSAEAPYALLGMSGVKRIRSLGIDGGSRYAETFDNLGTLLANGRTSFDLQFQEIAKSVFKYGLDAAPLDEESPVRVFVAATPEQMLSVQVLEYSIRKHSTMSVELVPLHTVGISIPMPRDPANRPRTPFSFQRFLIPQATGYAGKAVYLDSDMQVLGDIRELWRVDMGENQLVAAAASDTGRDPQYSVMLLDCARLDWSIERIVADLDNGLIDYQQLMAEMRVAAKQEAAIDPEWNSLERFVPGVTRLVHYTDMTTQPWVSLANPLGYLWVKDLIEAVHDGFVSLEEVRAQAMKGWIRPSLVYQVEHGIADCRLIPPSVAALDAKFVAPFQKLPHMRPLRWQYVRYSVAKLRSAIGVVVAVFASHAKAIKRRWKP